MMSRMPRLAHPAGMPEEVWAINEIFGNSARIEILHRLAREGPLTTTELASRIGATNAGTHNHLRMLEEAGLIRADVDQEVRHGRTVRWSRVDGRVRGVLERLSAYINGDEPPLPVAP